MEDIVTERVEEEQLDVLNESEVVELRREKALLRELKTFSQYSYFFIRTSDGNVIDIDHGFQKRISK